MNALASTKAQGEFMARAAGAFMVISVEVKRYEGIKRSRDVARRAEESAGADRDVATGGIKLLGKHHADLKLVNAANKRISTYLYENALPSEVPGEFMFHVDQVPQAIADLSKLKAEAEQVLAEFLPMYDNFVAAAKSQLAALGKGAKYPSTEEMRGKFAISISAPDFVPVADLERFKHLPVAQAKEWAAEAEKKVARKIEGARAYILDNTRKFMADTERALGEEKFRTTDKKIKEVKHLSTQLRQLVSDWDNDPRLLALADLIDEKIAPVIESGKLKEDSVKRSQVRRAAKTVVKGIDAHNKNTAKLKAAADKSAKGKGKAVVGGLMADLM